MTAPVTSFGPWTYLGTVTTTDPSGKFRSNDNIGDTFMDLIDGKYRLVVHMAEGISYFEKAHDGDPLTGWVVDDVINPSVAIPKGIGTVFEDILDTPCMIQHPTTGELFIYSMAEPGDIESWKAPGDFGEVQCAVRAWSSDPGIAPENWSTNGNVISLAPHEDATWTVPYKISLGGMPEVFDWAGGIKEFSVVYEPTTHEFVMFFIGQLQNTQRRYGRATAPIATPDTFTYTPTAGPTSWVWSPTLESGWGQVNLPFHPSVSRAPDGVYWLAMKGLPLGGGNPDVGLGLWYSLDMGFTWTQVPGNPILDRTTLGFPGDISNFVGSPNLFFDPAYRKVYLQFDMGGAPAYTRYQEGAALGLMVADAIYLDRPGKGEGFLEEDDEE